MYSDFDKDGVKNIDDPYPADSKKFRWKDARKHPEYYRKARYGNNEVLLSEELQAIERYNNSRIPFMNKTIAKNKPSKVRIKTVPSTIKKLREKYLEPRTLSKEERRTNRIGIYDIVGMKIVTKNRKEALRKSAIVKKKNKTDKVLYDNYYRKPKGDVYYAVHHSIINPKDRKQRIEMQITSKRMSNLADSTHSAYKHKESMQKYIKKGKKLFREGY